MLSDNEIIQIALQLKADSVGYGDEIARKREILMDYFNMQPYGNELEGRSKYVSSEVSDVVLTMLPIIVNTFTSSYNVFEFKADLPDQEEEARQKSVLANYAFHRLNPGTKILNDAVMDALLQYTGVMKVHWEENNEVVKEEYEGLSVEELLELEQDPEVEILELTERQEEVQGFPIRVFDVTLKRTCNDGKPEIDNIPPEELLLAPSARDFEKPVLIGQRTPKRRSELLQMGFDPEIVNSLPSHEQDEDNTGQATARYYDQNRNLSEGNHKPNDIIYLSEMYVYIDADEDGVAELWQIFEAGDKLLEKNLVDEHPYAVLIPISIPHKAIGSCPAEQVADLQFTKSILVRHMLDNVYNTNYQRYAVNERVDLDDMLTPRPGGIVRVDGEEPIGDAVSPMIITPQVQQILQSIDFLDTSQEKRTGVTRFNQGLNPDALNQTATGFMGIDEYSKQRVGLIMKLFAETGLKELGRKLIKLFEQHQDTALQVRLTGDVMEVDPSRWRSKLDCYVNVGISNGSRQEKLVNLNNILERQVQAIQQGSSLADESKVYNTLESIVHELGLKDASLYFNDPTIPAQVAQAQNEQLKAQVQQLTQAMEQAQNQLAEAEHIRAQAELVKAEMRKQEATQKDAIKIAELEQKDEHFKREMAHKEKLHNEGQIKDLTELELKYNKDVPGSQV